MSRTALRLSASVILALVAACMAALLVASTKPAQAAFPGTNGAIAFAGAPEQSDIDYGVFRKPRRQGAENVGHTGLLR